MQAYNSYSRVMFTPKEMGKVVHHLVAKLPALASQFGFDTIVVTGKSGAALGFTLSMMTGLHVVYIRKGESTHGDMVEGDGHEFTRYAFLDDFVSAGNTRDRVHTELAQYCHARSVEAPERVLTIEYQNAEYSDNPKGGMVTDDVNGEPAYIAPAPKRIKATMSWRFNNIVPT